MSRSTWKIGTVLLAAIFILVSCNLPREGTPTPVSGIGMIQTQAAQTLQVQITKLGTVPPTLKPTDTPVPEITETQPVETPPDSTPSTPTPTQTAVPCDKVEFVEDVTVPDDTEIGPGVVFTKTWKLRNTGTCTWNPAYSLVFTGGERMGAEDAAQLSTGSVVPGETVEVSVELTAPDKAGTYKGEFKLRNSDKEVFGLGDGTKPFWLRINVVVASGVVFDFLSNAKNALWTSGTGNQAGFAIAYNGTDNDPNGAAKIKDQVELENGTVSGKVLLTFPLHDTNGMVMGTFSPYTVQPGDIFRTYLGFYIPSGQCGQGNVIFEFGYEFENDYHKLADWQKTCDGKLLPVSVDLASLKGKEVKFVIKVHANGSFQDDFAIWNSTMIKH